MPPPAASAAPLAPHFTPLSHAHTLAPPLWISGSFDGDFNKLPQNVAYTFAAGAARVNRTPATPVDADQAPVNYREINWRRQSFYLTPVKVKLV